MIEGVLHHAVMGGLRELNPFVLRVDRQMVLAHCKLDCTLSMLEVLVVQLVEPMALPEKRHQPPVARDELARAESLLRVIKSRLRRLVVRPRTPEASERQRPSRLGVRWTPKLGCSEKGRLKRESRTQARWPSSRRTRGGLQWKGCNCSRHR